MPEVTDRNLGDEDEDLDATSELPVLSEAEIVAADADSSDAGETEGTDGAGPPGARAAAGPLPSAELGERILETLAFLREDVNALRSPGPPAAERELETLRERLREREDELEQSRVRLAEREAELEAARARFAALTDSDADPRAELAALTDYITNRREHWEALEARVDEQAQRMRELEAELEQRIARQHEAEALAAQERERADEYRTRLSQHVDRLRDLRSLAERSSSGETEIAAEDEDAGDRTGPDDVPELGALVCLTSEPPERYAVAKPVLMIGRSTEADIRIPTHVVSREHARVRNDGRAVYIDDLGSRNGVFVNSMRVDSRELHDGDWITIGETQFRYIAAGGT